MLSCYKIEQDETVAFYDEFFINPVPYIPNVSAVAGDIKLNKMVELKKFVAAVFMLFATAPIFGAEGIEATSTTTSSVNGDQNGVEWRAVTDSLTSKTWLQMQVPGYGEHLVEPSWATRLKGRFISASADSTGVCVKVELDKAGQTLERTFVCRDSTWLKALSGQAVAWTEVSFETEKEYRTVADYQLLSKANAGHYAPFNEEYTRPRFIDETAQSQFGKPDFSKKQASAKKGKKGDFRITTTDEETRTTKRGKKVKVLRG